MSKKKIELSYYEQIDVTIEIGTEVEILKPIWHIDCDGPFSYTEENAKELAEEYGEQLDNIFHKKAGTTEFITKIFDFEDETYIAIDSDMKYDCGQFTQHDFVYLLQNGIIKLKSSK